MRASETTFALATPIALGMGFLSGLLSVVATAAVVAGGEASLRLPGTAPAAILAGVVILAGTATLLGADAATRRPGRASLTRPGQTRHIVRSVHDTVCPLELHDPRPEPAG